MDDGYALKRNGREMTMRASEAVMMGENAITRVEDMPVFQASMELAHAVERVSRSYGPDFRWLRVQMLRSSEAVAINIAEGFYAQYSTEYLQCLYRARREARETQTHLRYALGIRQLGSEQHEALIDRYEGLTIQLAKLIVSIERKVAQHGKAKRSSFTLKDEPDGQTYLDGPEDELRISR